MYAIEATELPLRNSGCAGVFVILLSLLSNEIPAVAVGRSGDGITI